MKHAALTLLALGALSLTADAQNFGIGTTAPTSRLSVVGSGSSDDDILLLSHKSSPEPGLLIRSSRGTEASPSDLSAGDNIGNVWFTGRTGGSYQMMSGIDADFNGNTNRSNLRFLTSGQERLGIDSNGYVGISTNNPPFHLTVTSNGAGGGAPDDMGIQSFNTVPSNSFFFRAAHGSEATPTNLSDGSEIGSIHFTPRINSTWANASSIRAFYRGNGITNASNLRFYTSEVERMHIGQDGYVGIGTNAPVAPLHVEGSASRTTGYGYLNPSGQTGTSGSQTNSYSIWASHRIACSEFNAVSDARLKNVTGRADGAADLDLLRQLRITNYMMRDKVQHGDKSYRKVIAQEVEAVYPMAVSKAKGFVPTVYAKVSFKSAEGRATITTPAAHGMKAGDKVRLIGEVNGTVETEVLAASGNTFTAALPKEETSLFVYGPEVSDLRTVDYEAIAMLNVSATQELDKKVSELQSQIVSLAAENESLRKEAVAHAELAERVKELQQMLGVKPQTSGAKVGRK